MTSQPSDFEQLMVELINRARTDPSGELDHLILSDSPVQGAEPRITSALNFFNVDIALLRSQLDGISPVAPLAWSEALGRSSLTHSELMVQFDEQDHNLPGEPSLGDRIRDEQYFFSNAGENIFAFTHSPLHGHAGFYIDWGFTPTGIQNPPGHRNSILSSTFREIGIGVVENVDPTLDVGPNVVTQHFGKRFGTTTALTGVVIDDTDNDDFYDIGEGLGGVSVTAQGSTQTFSTVSYASGGYTLELPTGTYTVTFSGGELSGSVTRTVTIDAQNVKLDIEQDDAGSPTEIQGDSQDNALKGGAGDQTISGLDGADTLTGGAGDDHLFGGDGNDQLLGQGDSDILHGDAGADTVRGGAGVDQLFGGGAGDLLTGQGSADTLHGDNGADDIYGGSGNDVMYGGAGQDELFGQGNNDVMYGGGSNDTLTGAAGLDTLFGDNGDDRLFGGDGRDTLEGGVGNDFLNGGAQDDRFVFAGNMDMDTISGFQDDIDTIQIASALAGEVSVTALLGNAAKTTQIGGSVEIDFGGGDVLRINNMTIAQLQDDILLV